MLKLIEFHEGNKREVTRGTLEEITSYLIEHTELYDWINENEFVMELPTFQNIEDIRDLKNELNKIDCSWWTLSIKK